MYCEMRWNIVMRGRMTELSEVGYQIRESDKREMMVEKGDVSIIPSPTALILFAVVVDNEGKKRQFMNS